MDGFEVRRFWSAIVRRARRLAGKGSDQWSALLRGVRWARESRRRFVAVMLTLILVASGSVVATGAVAFSLPDIVTWFGSMFTEEPRLDHPTRPQLAETTASDDNTGELGTEDFYRYAGVPSGSGSSTMVNLHTGNALFSYGGFANPSRGHATVVQLTYNSLDREDDTPAGVGWSIAATALTRLGSPLDFHPPGLSWPTTVTLTDGDGTSHVFRLNKHDSRDQSVWDYDHPPGLHQFLQRNGGNDPARAWVMTAPDRTRSFFDEDGHQTATVDRNGNELRFVYAEDGSHHRPKFLKEIIDPAGRRTLAITYFAKGDTYTFVDDDGNPVTKDDLRNPHIIDRVRTMTDVDGRVIEFVYTDKGLLAQFADGAGTPLAKTYQFGYNEDQSTPNTRLVTITDPRGNATKLSYFDAPTNVKFKGLVQSLTDRRTAVTTFDYVDPDGHDGGTLQTTVTDALAHATRHVLDGRGRPVKATDAKGRVTEIGWDADNNLVQQKEPNGATSTSVYDANTGYPVEVADAEANANQTPPARLTYQTQLNGHVADLATSASPEGRTSTFGHDQAGNVTSHTDPAGTASPAAGDFTTTYTYDATGQLTAVVDANGHRTTFGGYGPTGQPGATTDALGHTTSMAYDARGNPVSVTDAKGRTSTLTFDLYSRPLVSRVPKNAAAGAFIVTPAPVYDANDNITVSTAANGATTTATYDAADQLTDSLAPKDTVDSPVRRTSFAYDAVGNLLAVTEPNGNLTDDPNDFVTRYAYDEVYQTVTTTNAGGGVMSYTYDDVGNLTTVVDPNRNATADPADFRTRFSYDRNHRARTSTDAAGFTASVDYDRDGLATATTDEEGNKTLLAYDPRGLLTEMRVPHDTVDGASLYHTTRFEYDQVGNRTKVVSPRGVDTTDDPDDFAQSTVYDELDRVKEQILPFDKDHFSVNKPTDKVINTYDEVGNLVKVSLPPSGGLVADQPQVRVDTSYTHFDNGWLATSTDPFGVVTGYDYDALGGQSRRTTTGADGELSRTITWSYFPDGKLATKDDGGFPFKSVVALVDSSDRTPAVRFEGPQPWVRTNAGTGFVGYDYNTHTPGTGANSVVWNPTITEAGTYEVFVRYPAVEGAATNATYTLFGQTRTVDQTQHAGEWVSLGAFPVPPASGGDEVRLTDAANGIVVADGVKFVRDLSGTPDLEFHSFAYSYDANGNKTTMKNNSDIAEFDEYAMSYTGLNQLSKMDEKRQGGLFHTSTYAYDPTGNLTKRTYDSRIDRFEFDPRDQVTKVINAASASDLEPETATYTYTPRGQLSRGTRGLGNTIDYSYFADGRLRHLIEHGGANNESVIAEHTLTYDLNGNATRDDARLMNADNSREEIVRNSAYTYDPRDRVNVVDYGVGKEEYAYDANNNVLVQVLTNATHPGRETISSSFDRNRLIETLNTRPGFGSESNYFYDSLGRLTTIDSDRDGAGQARYTYDGFSRKFQYEQDITGLPGQVSLYFYDALDRITRAQKFKQDPGGGSQTTAKVIYRYLGASDLVLTEDRNDGEQLTSYRYGLNGQRLSQDTDTNGPGRGEFFYSSNARGDVEAITIPSGQTAATYGYTVFGQDITDRFTGLDKPEQTVAAAAPEAEPTVTAQAAVAEPRPPVNVYRFGARLLDQFSGFYDVGFRDYSPSVSQFLTPDHFSGAQADLRLGPIAFDLGGQAGNVGVWEWVQELGRSFINHIKEDPWQFVGEVAIGIAAAAAVGLVCATGIGCAILAGAAAGAASAAYGYGVDVAQGEHSFDAGDFTKQTLIGAGIGAATAGLGIGISRGVRAILGRGAATAGANSAATATIARLPQDIRVNPTPPPLKPIFTRDIGRNATQNAALRKRIRDLLALGARDVRVNQEQLALIGPGSNALKRVGINKPDLQYTLRGQRYYEEFESPGSLRGPGHEVRIKANDPTAIVHIWYCPPTCP